MKRIGLKWILTGIGLAGLVLASTTFAYSLSSIYARVEEVRRTAGNRYGGDKVSALMSLAEDGQAPFRLRNEACWALGQIGDSRALPLLRDLDTEEAQTRPWNRDACIVQYTVEKAIRQINGDFSLTRWMYARLE